ncbi:DUF4833 domain-containing protein [candidate division TA06 bacterium]|uniref:DUF4833 domain-containing protein n=1 Tax=candidate division TA06 bacterium TaxID=2250710 RepID=A0A933MJ85_UNCT6|nr:DUF4833 domain-containing protein [candidate division TA06 bacterium]
MKRATLILSLCLVLSGLALAQSAQPLFLIERTKNINKLYYEANVAKNGEINAKNPVRAFWIMWAKDSTGQTTEPLSFLEKKVAYGYNVELDSSGKHFNMTLKPFKERLIKIYLQEGSARAEMLINGQPSYFEKMYIYSKGDSKPDSIKLYGTGIESGSSQCELVIPKK